MIVKNSSRNARLIRIFIFCLLLAPCAAGAAIKDHITKTESGFYYTIQKGDTLWDLSRHFSDSPWVWPDLWSRNNPRILNPHRIYPGQKILIYRKDWQGVEKTHHLAQPPAAPIKTAKIHKPGYRRFLEIDRAGFIRKTVVPYYGTIFKSKNDIKLIGQGDMVYIYPEPGAPALTVGGKYTTFRTFDHIRDPGTRKEIGVQHLLTGIVEITEVNPEFAAGTIITAYRDIEVNDLLMPYIQRDENISVGPGIAGLSGQVIKPEDNRLLTGEDAIIFINKGASDGVKPGQQYSIFLQTSGRPNPKETRQVELTPLYIGDLVVLQTEPTTSTVLVTHSKQQILPGNIVTMLAAKTP